MTPIRTLALTTAAAAALVTGAVFAAPAMASGPPHISPGDSHCYQTDYADTSHDSRDHFECDYEVFGGTGTIHAAYYVNGSLYGTGSAPASTSSYTYFGLIGICQYEQTTTILARFTDSTGAQDSATYTVYCEDSF